MIIKALPEADAQSALSSGEFPEAATYASNHVAIILTQNWCPQWIFLNNRLASFLKKNPDIYPELTVFYFIYDLCPFFSDFLFFKENILGNTLIPYIRYYRKGSLTDESNYVSIERFLENFS